MYRSIGLMGGTQSLIFIANPNDRVAIINLNEAVMCNFRDCFDSLPPLGQPRIVVQYRLSIVLWDCCDVVQLLKLVNYFHTGDG